MGHYRPNKQKAVSPLEVTHYCSTTKTGQAGQVNKHTDKQNDSERSKVSNKIKNKSTTYDSEVNIQNCHKSQTLPYCSQYPNYIANINHLSAVNLCSQTQITTGASTIATPPQPPCAIEIMECIKCLKESMLKIDKIEKKNSPKN